MCRFTTGGTLPSSPCPRGAASSVSRSLPHPLRAAYVLGPERGALTPELAARCQHLVRIPTAFSLNVATAGAIVMYDRLRSLGRFGSRPVAAGAEAEPPRLHIQGGPKRVRRVDRPFSPKEN